MPNTHKHTAHSQFPKADVGNAFRHGSVALTESSSVLPLIDQLPTEPARTMPSHCLGKAAWFLPPIGLPPMHHATPSNPHPPQAKVCAHFKKTMTTQHDAHHELLQATCIQPGAVVGMTGENHGAFILYCTYNHYLLPYSCYSFFCLFSFNSLFRNEWWSSVTSWKIFRNKPNWSE